MSRPCFACVLSVAQKESTGDLTPDKAFVLGVAHAVEMGILDATRNLCRQHEAGLRSFGETFANARRKVPA